MSTARDVIQEVMTEAFAFRSGVKALFEARFSVQQECRCSPCQSAATEAAPSFLCETCGYAGRPIPLACDCYDYQCPGGQSAGAGCPHGALSCPFCDDGEGEISGWDIVRALRLLYADPHRDIEATVRDGSQTLRADYDEEGKHHA